MSETDHDCKVYFHRLGTPVASDAVVYERPDHPSWQLEPHLTADGRYLVIAIGDGEVGDRGQEQIVVLDIAASHAKPVAIVDAFEAEYVLVGSDGPLLYFQTTHAAERKSVIAIDLRAPAPAHWRELVPEGPDAIESAARVGGMLAVTTLKDAHHAIALYDLKGRKVRDVELPGMGTAYATGGPGDDALYFVFAGFTSPGVVYRHDLAKGTTAAWRAPQVPFAAADFETTQVFYPSKDGTEIPMFVTARKGLPREGTTPTLLTAYGGFGISTTP